MRSPKALCLTLVALSGAATLLAWAMPWFELTLATSAAQQLSVEAPGEIAAPALSALGLAGLALTAALGLVGPVMRIVLAIVQIALGTAVTASSALALSNPIAASARIITETTGVAGTSGIAELVSDATPTVWPFVALVVGCVSVLSGVAIIVTARRWPGPTRKYDANPADAGMPADDTVSDWDRLSDGTDPTSR